MLLGDERNLCAQPPAGPPKTHLSQGEAYFSENLLQHADLKAVQSFATEFSWTFRFQNLNPHGFNLKRYNCHQNPPSELKIMHGFSKFWTKFVGQLLDHVLPRCTIILLYELYGFASLQAMCVAFAC